MKLSRHDALIATMLVYMSLSEKEDEQNNYWTTVIHLIWTQPMHEEVRSNEN